MSQLPHLQAASVSDTPGSEGGTAGFMDQIESADAVPDPDKLEGEDEEIAPS